MAKKYVAVMGQPPPTSNRPEAEPVALEGLDAPDHTLPERYIHVLDDLLSASLTLDSHQLLNRVAERIGALVLADLCFITLWDEQRQQAYPYTVFGAPDQSVTEAERPPGQLSLTEKVLQAGQPLVMEDMRDCSLAPFNDLERYPSATCLGLPLQNGNDKIGAIFIVNTQGHRFTAPETALYQQIGRLISLALSQARLFAATKRQIEELRVLRDIALVGAQAGGEDVLLERATQIIGDVFFPDNFGFLLLDENQNALVPHHSYRGTSIKDNAPVPLDKGITGYVASTGRSRNVPDVSQDPRYIPADTSTRSELCVPLQVDNQLLGVLNAESVRTGAFTDDDERLMITLSGQLATALQKIRLLQAERQRRAEAEAMRETARRYATELEGLFELSTALRNGSAVDEMLPVILRKSKAATQSSLAVVALLDEGGDTFTIRDMLPPWPAFLGQQYRLMEWVSPGQTRHMAADLLQDPAVILGEEERAFLREYGGKALVSVPLRTSQSLLGFLFLMLKEEEPLPVDKVKLLEAMAEIVAGGLQRVVVMNTLEQRVDERTRELAAANERLKELDRLKSKFISDVSHELRTPITNLGLYLDLLERGRPDKEQQYRQVLRQQIDRLKFLIEDILRLSRLDTGRDDLVFAPVDLPALIAEVIDEERKHAADKGLVVTFRPEPNLPLLDGEAYHLKRVVENLLVNAINYTPAGSITLRCAYDPEAREIIFSVADTGLGIAPEDRPHIFERFYRGWNPSELRAPGTGLGLAIVQEIVHLHGGRISVESELNHGSTFTVFLPVHTQ